MGQKPAEPVCGNAARDEAWDESVLILIRHCRDMKRQETSLRLITLLLLLSCSALYIFTTCIRMSQETATASQQKSPAGTSAAYSRQEKAQADDPETTTQQFHMQLTLLPQEKQGDQPCRLNRSDHQNLKWQLQFSQSASTECDNERPIRIPQEGVYFVFVSFSLGCASVHKPGEPSLFYAELRKWNQKYPENQIIAVARESLTCSSNGFRTVFVGRLFDLMEGDLLSVWISSGYELIRTSSFGAYRVQ